jgi:hypothetical protein
MLHVPISLQEQWKTQFPELINCLKQDSGRNLRSIIVKVQSPSAVTSPKEGEYIVELGCQNKGGSYHTCYTRDKKNKMNCSFDRACSYVELYLKESLKVILARYIENNSRRRTLFFRYNLTKNEVEVFSSGNVGLKTKLTMQAHQPSTG